MKTSLLLRTATAAFVTFLSAQQSFSQTISAGDLGIGLIVAEDPSIQKLNLYKVNPNGSATLLQSNIFPERTLNTFQASQSIVDTATGKIYLREPDQGQGSRYRIYNAATNSFEGYTTLSDLPTGASPQFLTAPLQLNSVARREGDELHIGENSFITREANGRQEIYAQDANGNAIPLNATNGSDLQINGISVQGQIDDLNTTVNASAAQINSLNTTVNTHTNQINSLNTTVDTHTNQINNLNNRVGSLETNVNTLGSGVAGATALSAALTALPATSDDAPVSCGVGSGGYSSRYSMGFGCAAKVTERLAFNAGGSFVFGGASNYGGGTLDNVAGRLGFVLKIGKMNPSSNHAISKRTNKLESQLSQVKNENQKILSENQRIISENQNLTAHLAEMKALIAMQNERVANLEKVAKAMNSTERMPAKKINRHGSLEVASNER